MGSVPLDALDAEEIIDLLEHAAVVIGQLAGQQMAELVNAEHAPGERSLAELSIDLALAAADLSDAAAEHTALTPS
jgi:hypothetical protein